MTKILEAINSFVWGAPTLVLILGVGLYLSVRTGFPQITLFPKAICLFFRRLLCREGTDSSFRCLCTALAATVGTGNLAGVAGAICLGGPGAIFWMWVSGFLGMATKYAEATLAVRYRCKENGEVRGGPMYIISQGLGERWKSIAVLYCLFGVLASFGVGNAAQINTLTTAVGEMLRSFGWEPGRKTRMIFGVFLAVSVTIALLGGTGRIGAAAEKLIPFASAGYFLLCIVVLALRFREIPGAFAEILTGAFSPRAVTGGMLGFAFTALRIGCSRGAFTNEAGMGTAAIAHGSAEVDHPCEQGLMGIMEVFLDTIVICTLTAQLTEAAFSQVLGRGASIFLAAAVCCFAFATVLGWGLYGGRCLEYLTGGSVWKGFAIAQGAMALLGAMLETGPVWLISETFNGLMAIPNLYTLVVLTKEVCRLTIDFRKPAQASRWR